MVRKRGISFLSTALAFLVFGALTLLWIPEAPRGGFGEVRVQKTETAAKGPAHSGQEAIDAEPKDNDGDAAVHLGGSSPTEGSDRDGPVSEEQGSSGAASLETVEGDAPVELDEGSPVERLDGDIEDTPPEVSSETSFTPSEASETHRTPSVETSEGTPDDAQPPPSETLTAHPIAELVRKAAADHEALLSRQSKTLEAAVREYRRRYAMPPPPHFDKWFAFAQSRNISLTDEFDTIHDMLTPFWGLEPSTVRRRATEALGYANNVQGLLIRDGKVALQSGGKEWERDALSQMVSGFVAWLPDMDLVFNTLDEPRVVLPHEDLARLVERGREAQARMVETPSNAFTKHADDLGDGSSIPEVSTSRFVYMGRQSAWSVSRMSCPPTSPVRSLDDAEDDEGSCGPSRLCFVSNTTAQTDICASPSLRHTHGFFDRPNSLSISHDLVPVFSPSKLSSFQDIVFPAPWYWAGRVPYNASADVPWAEKKGDLYWRGSTTGGFSRWGGWRRHHRQRAVLRLNSDDPTTVFSYHPSNTSGVHWEARASTVSRHAHLLDVSFTHVGQCDPGDCAAQRARLPLAPHAPQHAAFAHKFLLDMDGNAFSGRFQTFLRSASLVLKMAVFREWSSGWVVPWRDYVPLSVGGGEWVEAVRYLEGEGSDVAEGMARRAGVGRAEMEVWLFRLLLE